MNQPRDPEPDTLRQVVVVWFGLFALATVVIILSWLIRACGGGGR